VSTLRGIAGLMAMNGQPVATRDVAQMLRTSPNFSVEGAALWGGSSAVLGQSETSAATATRTRPRLPTREAGNRVIAADLRLDNREDLIAALGLRTGADRQPNDDELVLEAYGRWSDDCPSRLVGAFAFAIWDGSLQRLFCARDLLGMRPFYYHISNGFFAFGSEIAALLIRPGVRRTLNEKRIADYLMHAEPDPAATYYDEIHRLPPAQSMVVAGGGVHLRKYWEPASYIDSVSASDDAYPERFRDTFSGSVAASLRATGPVAALLSGGLDSSSITCVAGEQLQDRGEGPLDTFSVLFDDVPASDERKYMQAVIGQGRLRPHFVRGDQTNPLAELDSMLRSAEEPFFTPNLYLNWILLKAAREEGVRVLLDGFLGDNVVAHGSRLLTERAARGQWVSVLRDLYTISRRYPRPGPVAWSTARRFVLQPLIHEPLQRAWHGRFRRQLPLDPTRHFARRDLLNRTGWLRRSAALDVLKPRTPRTARAEHLAELTSGILPGAVEIAVKAGRSAGVEVRFPFADRRLVEFCLALPPEQKYDHGWTRLIVRRALADSLPPKIRWRTGKANLGPAFEHSLLVVGRADLRSAVYDRLAIAADFLDVQAVQNVYRQLHRGPGSLDRLQAVWQAVVLARWLELLASEPRSGDAVPAAIGAIADSTPPNPMGS
jgi:asparagine synthase (glutamine-hydrolysing)